MNLEEVKKIAAARTPGEWDAYSHVLSFEDVEFVWMAAITFDKLLAAAEVLKFYANGSADGGERAKDAIEALDKIYEWAVRPRNYTENHSSQ